jgi:hypothetical protein
MTRRTSKLTPPVWPNAAAQPVLMRAAQALAVESLAPQETVPTRPGQWPVLAQTSPWETGNACTSCGADLGPGSSFCSQCGSPQAAIHHAVVAARAPRGQRLPVIPVPVVVVAAKSVGLAAFLEFLFPGAGLAYLGRIFPAVFVFLLSLALGVGIVALTSSTQCLGLFAVLWLIVRLGGIINDTERFNRQAVTQLR